jgi:hypothetical protein
MRTFTKILLAGCLLVLPVTAQRGGGMRGGGAHGGGGGFHGGGGFSRGSAFRGGSSFRGGYGGFRGGFRGGYGGYNRGFYGGNRFFFGFGSYPYGYSYWPYYDWGYPYYYGYPSSYYNYGYPAYGYNYAPSSYYDYGYSQAPQVAIYQSEPAAPVTVYESQRPARSEIREYRDSSSPRNEKPIYLIGFKNQDNIRAAEAYWVAGGTLHYVSLQHEQKQAPLESVDRAVTYRLNHERHVDFRLPDGR